MSSRALTATVIVTGFALWGAALMAAPGKEEWERLKADVNRAFAAEDAAARTKAVEGLGGAGTLDAVKLLVTLLDAPDKALAAAEQERDAYEPEFDKTLAAVTKVALANNNMVPSDQMEAFAKKEKKMLELNAQVRALSGVQDAIVEALGRAREPEAWKWLAGEGLKDRLWRTRGAVARALGAAPATEAAATPALLGAVADKDGRVRAAAIEALARRRAAEAEAPLVKALADERWQVRVAAAEALGALAPRTAVGPLIDRIQQEAGRLREDIDRALKAITGVSFGGDPLGWKGWWELNRADWESGKLDRKPEKPEPAAGGAAGGGGASPAGQTVTFYGITTKSKNLIFVVDISGSMKEEDTAPQTISSGGGPSGGPKGKRKIDVARWELARAIGLLPEDARFNIITFSSDVRVYAPKMVVANKSAKAAAQKFAESLEPEAATNIYDALEKAFELAGGHKQIDENYKEGVDTIFFLTDGQPTTGKTTDGTVIADAVKKWNAVRKIRIHTIGIGQHAEELLRRLAEESGGTYVKR